MKPNLTEHFLEYVWKDIVERTPGISTLSTYGQYLVELGFIYGATIIANLMGGMTDQFPPEIVKLARQMLTNEGKEMMNKLKERVLKEKVSKGAMPDITGYPLDKEFKL